MTDSRLRELERRWRTTGAEDDRLAYDSARVRAGVAIETGFIVRTRDSAGAYRDKARVYCAGVGAQDVSFRKIIGGGSVVRDIEYADGAFQVLAVRRTGVNSISRVFTVDIAGDSKVSFEMNSSHENAPDALLNKDGELGRVHQNQFYRIEFAKTRVGLPQGDVLLGCVRGQRYLAMRAGTEVGGNPQVVEISESGESFVIADGGHKVDAVFVEGSYGYCRWFKPRGEFFEGTRLAEGRYFANDELSLLRAYQGRALTLTKTLLEVPKKCLEGLLIAV